MIITDPLKRPSKRFIEVVQGYFISKGYSYKTSLNQFARTVDNRKEMVSIFYNKTINLVSATLSWSILFPQLEKVFKIINVEEWLNNRQMTLSTDLLNYHPRRQTDISSDFDLYSSKDYKYDDISLNKAASDLIKSYEKYVEPFFEHYKDLRILEKELNEIPLRHHYYIGYGGRQIAIGLTLGKRFQRKNADLLNKSYQEYILNDKEGEEFKQKMQKYFDSALSFLDKNDIDKFIS